MATGDSDRWLVLIFRALTAAFAGVGALFFLAPDGTIAFLNSAGSLLGVFTPAPQSGFRLWLSLGVSYMAVVTALAWTIQKAPRRNAHLMPILALGKACSSLTSLWFFLAASPAFAYLLNFLVDGSITFLVLACWAWVALSAPERVAPTVHEIEALDAFLGTLIAADDAAGTDLRSLRGACWQYVAEVDPLGLAGLRLLLGVLEWGPFVFGPRPARFTRLSPDDRVHYLEGFERSRFGIRRQLIAGIKMVVMLHQYDRPGVWQDIGYSDAHLRSKLLAGPNARWHLARLNAGGISSDRG